MTPEAKREQRLDMVRDALGSIPPDWRWEGPDQPWTGNWPMRGRLNEQESVYFLRLTNGDAFAEIAITTTGCGHPQIMEHAIREATAELQTIIARGRPR